MKRALAALAAVAGFAHASRPDVVRRQEQVEVEHFAAVVAFQEAHLDRLAHVHGVDHGEQGILIGVDGVVGIDQYLAETIGVEVDGIGQAREASDAGDTGDDSSRQAVSVHRNTPKLNHRAFCFTADLARSHAIHSLAGTGQGQATAQSC
jgi:hypothetical protein